MMRRTPRRNFLLGRPGDPAEDPGPPVAAASDAQPAYLVQVNRRAMACEFEICLPAEQYSLGTEVVLGALDLLEPLEQQMSVFRPGGELCRINESAAEEAVEVDPRLFALVELALGVYRETGGAYDVTAGPLWQAWGFARRAGAIPGPEQLAEAQARVGGHLVELDHERHTIRFLRPGVELNLGSIGKGYAVDRCAEALLAGGIRDFLIHGGNSSALARGRQGGLDGWVVGLRDPARPEGRIAEIRLRDRALGTSGSQFQSFHHKGRRYGHVLDPRTGWPAEGVLSATVLAPSAALADALSTAFYVLGPEAALDYCRRHPEIAAVLICPAGAEETGTGSEPRDQGVSGSRCREVPVPVSSRRWVLYQAGMNDELRVKEP